MAASVHILIATSDAFMLADYRATLEDAGLQVSTATGGTECLEQLRADVPTLIVLDADILWGGAEGILAVLADDPALPAVPVMIVSSRRSRSTLYQMGRYMVSDYQRKPLSGKRLAQRITLLFASNSEMKSAIRARAPCLEFAGNPPGQ